MTVNLPDNWTVDEAGKKASVELETKDFMEAIDLINGIAPVAEEIQHHPDVHLTQWNRLRIDTWSHDVGKLTERDVRLAKRINEVLKKRGFLE